MQGWGTQRATEGVWLDPRTERSRGHHSLAEGPRPLPGTTRGRSDLHKSLSSSGELRGKGRKQRSFGRFLLFPGGTWSSSSGVDEEEVPRAGGSAEGVQESCQQLCTARQPRSCSAKSGSGGT